MLGLRCCTQAFSSCGEWGFSPVVVRGLLIAVASFVVEDGLEGARVSVVAACGLSYPAACGIFPEQGSNPCPLHWQANS